MIAQIPVVLATGKTFESTRAIRESIRLDSNERCVSIHVNGLVIHDHNGDIISEKALSTHVALRVMRECWAAGHPTILYSGSRIISREHNDLSNVMPQYHVCANTPHTLRDTLIRVHAGTHARAYIYTVHLCKHTHARTYTQYICVCRHTSTLWHIRSTNVHAWYACMSHAHTRAVFARTHTRRTPDRTHT